MNEEEIKALEAAVKSGSVMWMPDHETAKRVVRVGMRSEGGTDELEPAASFADNKYVALYACSLSEFKSVAIHPIAATL